jgi:hypothetical protein
MEMDISDGRKIYPDPVAEGMPYEPADWVVPDDGPFARHLPTHTIWRIDFNRESPSGGRALNDWYATLAHVCQPHYGADEGLDDETMDFIGRGAIAFYLQAIGAWKPEVVVTPDTPEQKRIKSRFPVPH